MSTDTSPDVIYLDSNILIHIVEGDRRYRPVLERLVAAIEAKRLSAVTCVLSLAEVLVRPLRESDEQTRQAFEALLSPDNPDIGNVAINRELLLRSARLSAELGLKLPDAIHVAAAETANCSVFLTEDRRIKVPAPMKLRDLADFDLELLQEKP
jgi:predicted nucleic acid-binding protein